MIRCPAAVAKRVSTTGGRIYAQCLWGVEATKICSALVAGLLLVFILTFDSPMVCSAFAQDWQHPRYRLQERRNPAGQVDRREGIQPLEIAGETLTLVAAHLSTSDLSGASQGDIYRLGFYLREAEPSVNIKARDYKKFPYGYHYWMLPTRTQFTRGFQEFTWDASLIRDLGMQLEDFGAIAWLGGYGYPVVAPVLLHTAPFPSRIQVQGCRFIFVPNETMTVVYSLAPRGHHTPVLLQQDAEKWHKDSRQPVTWNGRDRQGHLVSEGLYVLKLTATVTPPGRPPEKIPYDVEFYYKPEISPQR